ncbi:MAG: HlyD family secretion protein [Salinivirgaceae bacterium]|nr:HlyD family secretion protein [Salinivirgaceae bacterium]
MNKTRNYIIGLVTVSICIFLAYSIYILTKPIPLEIQGEVEATQIKVASKLVGRIDSLTIHKGQEVKAGDLLFTIESPEVRAKLQQAEGVQNAAMATNRKAEKGARKEDIQAAFNVWKKAEAAAEYGKKSFARIENLYKEGVVPEQKKDEIETQMIAAVETEKAAKSVYDKALSGARIEDKAASLAMVQQANGVVSEVNAYILETRIFAPINGEIANIIAERGELIPAGYPVLTIVDLDDVWVSFNLREDLLADIQKGSEFTAKIPGLGMIEATLKVTYINVLGEYATWNATKTSGDFDMKTFEIHAVPTTTIKGMRPGMSVLVNWDQFRSKKTSRKK